MAVSILVGYGASSLGNQFPTFRDKVFFSSSRVYMTKKEILLEPLFAYRIFKGISTLENETITLSRKIDYPMRWLHIPEVWKLQHEEGYVDFKIQDTSVRKVKGTRFATAFRAAVGPPSPLSKSFCAII
jgi:hypothetical protein